MIWETIASAIATSFPTIELGAETVFLVESHRPVTDHVVRDRPSPAVPSWQQRISNVRRTCPIPRWHLGRPDLPLARAL